MSKSHFQYYMFFIANAHTILNRLYEIVQGPNFHLLHCFCYERFYRFQKRQLTHLRTPTNCWQSLYCCLWRQTFLITKFLWYARALLGWRVLKLKLKGGQQENIKRKNKWKSPNFSKSGSWLFWIGLLFFMLWASSLLICQHFRHQPQALYGLWSCIL